MTVTVKRPWYAHSPEYSTPLSFYRIITPMVPGTDGTAAPSICQHHVEEGDLDDHDADEDDDDELGVNWRPLVLSLSNFHGVCQMTLPSRWVNLDTPLLGKITFHDFTESVVSCHLLLIRAEHVQGDVKEKTLLIHQVTPLGISLIYTLNNNIFIRIIAYSTITTYHHSISSYHILTSYHCSNLTLSTITPFIRYLASRFCTCTI